MVLRQLIGLLMSGDELATSRVGLIAPNSESMGIQAAELLELDPRHANDPSPMCELVIVDAHDDTLSALPAAMAHLTRDGILVAALPVRCAEQAVNLAAESEAEWSAVIPGQTGDSSFLVAAVGIHPAELGSIATDHVVRLPGVYCVHVPQNRGDRRRRRVMRRRGRDRLLAFARTLDKAPRVARGIEMFVGERRVRLNHPGTRPAMFVMPGLTATPWPGPDRSDRLARVLYECEWRGAAVVAELQRLASRTELQTYVRAGYMADKFDRIDPDSWKAIELYDESAKILPLARDCRATRALLGRIAPQISGEAIVSRLAPNTVLPAHYDDNEYQLPIHVGLRIPPGCAIRVDGQSRSWRVGKAFSFSDAFLHEAWNESKQPRDILLIDSWHPDLTRAEIGALVRMRREIREILTSQSGPRPAQAVR